MQHILALSHCAVITRHWFEIDLDDASMEHGVRIEVRELALRAHRGSESAAQLITVDRPFWRADLFDRLADPPGSYAAAHYHPRFLGNEPSARTWDPDLSADPWHWLGDQIANLGGSRGGRAWRLEPADAEELSGLADALVALARRFAPDRCRSAAECFRLTRDAQESVQLMIENLHRQELLDTEWVSPWTGHAQAPSSGDR